MFKSDSSRLDELTNKLIFKKKLTIKILIKLFSFFFSKIGSCLIEDELSYDTIINLFTGRIIFCSHAY